jgi:hypothetical protein
MVARGPGGVALDARLVVGDGAVTRMAACAVVVGFESIWLAEALA